VSSRDGVRGPVNRRRGLFGWSEFRLNEFHRATVSFSLYSLSVPLTRSFVHFNQPSMKFLALQTLASAASLIDGVDTGQTVLTAKLECFSCKKAGNDKQLYFALDKEYKEEMSRSPQESPLSASPFGPMLYKRSRETLIDLISVLNASFPDYDFRSVRESQFVKEELANALGQINSRLASVLPNFAQIRDQFWSAVDQEMNLRECTVYSFTPDLDCNPFEEEGDAVWSFNYFFVEKKNLKRILLLTCREEFKQDDFMDQDEMQMQVSSPYPASPMGTGEFGMEMLIEDTY